MQVRNPGQGEPRARERGLGNMEYDQRTAAADNRTRLIRASKAKIGEPYWLAHRLQVFLPSPLERPGSRSTAAPYVRPGAHKCGASSLRLTPPSPPCNQGLDSSIAPPLSRAASSQSIGGGKASQRRSSSEKRYGPRLYSYEVSDSSGG